jgi:hypothetical protein
MDDLPSCTFNACNRSVDYHTSAERVPYRIEGYSMTAKTPEQVQDTGRINDVVIMSYL